MSDLAVPFLRSGTGSTPKDGGCVLQVIDWIDREGWTDQPECVHPVLRSLAIYVNDKLPDGERQQLLDLAPRLMGTNTGDEALTRKLLGHLARRVYFIYERWAKESGYDDKGSVLACIEAAKRGGAAHAAHAAGAAGAARAARAARAAHAAQAAWAAHAAHAARAARAARVAGAAQAAWAAHAAWAARAARAAWAAHAAHAAGAAGAAGAARAARAAHAAQAAWAAQAAQAAWAAWAAGAARAAWAAWAAGADLTPMSILIGCLDEYDRLTGRDNTPEITPEQFAAVCEVMR